MSELPSWTYYALAATGAIIFAKATAGLVSLESPLPPSPPGDLILGHARVIPHKEPHKTYAEWGKQYGDVVSVTAPGRTLVILNSYAAVHELLDKQSGVFSGRPYIPMFELMGWGDSTGLLQYGGTLRAHRRMILKYLSPSSAVGKVQQSHVTRFLKKLLLTPTSLRDHIHILVSGIIIEVVYGHVVTSTDDVHMKLIEESVRLVSGVGSVGATIIDLLPFLRYIPAWLPGMGLKRHALKTRKVIGQIIEKPFQEAKLKKTAGESISCMVADLLEDTEGTTVGEHEYELKMAAFTVYNVGADTSKTVLSTFFMMMVLHPDVAANAQKEIDGIIGSGPERLPTIKDRDSLPYLECVLKELYRINPPVPLGLPRTSTQEVQFRTWKIPKETTAFANIWQIARDEKFFPEPVAFRPERHEAKSNGRKNMTSEHGGDDPSALIFGFGRRTCPGKAFADSMLFLAFACVLATFDIRPYTDPVTGKAELPEQAFEGDMISVPKPFKCTIVPRSERRARLVRGLDMD